MYRSLVTVTREWHNPQINIHVTHLDIKLDITLDDFLKAIVEEAGNPTMLLTKAQLLARLEKAAEVVVDKVKQESIKIV